ncbi:MAG: SDR family oxidoreductase [Phycisphaeraceae bacterium]
MSEAFDLRKAYDLTGRVALVTGASRGIGRAIALGLGGCGATVAAHYAGNAAQAREVVEGMSGRGMTVQADLKDADAPRRIVEAVTAQLGRIDILVLNASVQYRRAWQEMNRAEFDEQIAVNLRSSLELMQLVAPAMVERRWGRIVTVGSVQQQRPHRELLPYGATKAAQEQLARNLARELAPYGVTVNNLAPGVIDTDRNAAVLADPDTRRRVEQWVPMKRIGTPEDCVAAALLLCSDAGAYITGVNLNVDGGAQLP